MRHRVDQQVSKVRVCGCNHGFLRCINSFDKVRHVAFPNDAGFKVHPFWTFCSPHLSAKAKVSKPLLVRCWCRLLVQSIDGGTVSFHSWLHVRKISAVCPNHEPSLWILKTETNGIGVCCVGKFLGFAMIAFGRETSQHGLFVFCVSDFGSACQIAFHSMPVHAGRCACTIPLYREPYDKSSCSGSLYREHKDSEVSFGVHFQHGLRYKKRSLQVKCHIWFVKDWSLGTTSQLIKMKIFGCYLIEHKCPFVMMG